MKCKTWNLKLGIPNRRFKQNMTKNLARVTLVLFLHRVSSPRFFPSFTIAWNCFCLRALWSSVCVLALLHACLSICRCVRMLACYHFHCRYVCGCVCLSVCVSTCGYVRGVGLLMVLLLILFLMLIINLWLVTVIIFCSWPMCDVQGFVESKCNQLPQPFWLAVCVALLSSS